MRSPLALLPSLFLRRIPLEAAAWAAGLLALACTDPSAPPLLDLCVFKALGVTFCPGCGLGHGIAYLFRGAFAASFQAHPLAPFAVIVLTGRIFTLLRDALAPAALYTEARSLCRK